MFVSYNFNFIHQGKLHLPHHDRAFNYGDGLFESVIFHKGKIRFLRDHLKRLKKGMKALGIEGVNGLRKEVVEAQVQQLIRKNEVRGTVRIKIMVWRKTGGLYTPDNSHFNVLISISPYKYNPEVNHLKLGVSQKVRLYNSPISKFKTCNALPYIIAGIEKQQSVFDDLILLDQKGNVSECTASNIYWVKDGTVFTPSLKTGCVAGISRKNIIKKLSKRGFEVKKAKASPTVLMTAQHIFLSNVGQLAHVAKFGSTEFKPFKPIVGLMA